ncbi:hypothetical protein CHUAL_007174 [Chamberlinius hualienensis]
MTSSFKSYVDLGEGDGGKVDSDIRLRSKLIPHLLPGEVIIAEARKVLKFTAQSEQRQGIIGSLFVTNFKLSFVTASTSYRLVDQSQENALLGPNDICLINIDSVYQGSKSSYKMKKLEPGSSISGRIKILHVHCRDFRVCTFGFKFCAIGDDKTIINAILHHAYPLKPELLFAYEYTGHHPSENDGVWKTCMFNKGEDYENELARLRCSTWRVSNINQNFTCKSYPSNIVVPSAYTDSSLTSVASNFPSYRLPVWSWGNEAGCVIIRACGLPTADNSYGHQIYEFIKAMKKAHPYNWDPVLMNLDDLLPNAKEICNRFTKFKDLCSPDTYLQFWEQDGRFWSTLDSSLWLQTVATCLNVSNQVATKIFSYKVSVVLKESKGRDLSCLISSLAQIILDPHYRTISGFQSLIQKEWVAMGHPFLKRLGRLRTTDKESPVFLLFLDCVWQMLQQCPAAFEFNEIYLTTVWDSAHISIFETFLFDSEYDRRRGRNLTHQHPDLRSVWDWHVQFNKSQIMDFINPLYAFAKDVKQSVQQEDLLRKKSPNSNCNVKTNFVAKNEVEVNDNLKLRPRIYRSPTMWSLRVLVNNLPDVKSTMKEFLHKWKDSSFIYIQVELPLIKLWRLCYFRWMPLAQVVGGGPPAEYIAQCRLIKEIKSLQRQIAMLIDGSSLEDNSVIAVQNVENVNMNNANKEEDAMVVTSAYPFSAGGTPSISGMTFSYFRQSSFIPSDDDLEND